MEGYDGDMTKVVLKVNGLSGGELYKLLDKKRINIEKYTQQAIIVSIHINIVESEVTYLAKCLNEIDLTGNAVLFVFNYIVS